MVKQNVIKEIIVSNEEFILKEVAHHTISRDNLKLPDTIKKVIVFYGIRRSGKTFILYDLFMRDPDSSIYIDFEDDRLADFELSDFERLRESFRDLKPDAAAAGRAHFFLDKVQNIKGWEKFCRRAVEREGIKIYVSGSSSKVMPAEMQTELRGRAWHIAVMPFSFPEYLTFRDINCATMANLHGRNKPEIKRHFRQYALWGGFPEVCLANTDFDKKKILREYLDAMFFKDVVERYRITNVVLLDRLFDKVLSSFATKMSLSSFYKQYRDAIPFSKDSLFSYYHHLQESLLIYEVRIFAESTYKRMRNPAKIYPADVGLCRKVTSQDSGRILETLVFIELMRRGFECFYFEGKNECDFIAKDTEGKLSAFQVCTDIHEGNRVREVNGLIEACHAIGRKDGVILTNDEEDEFSENGINITVMPVWKWLCS